MSEMVVLLEQFLIPLLLLLYQLLVQLLSGVVPPLGSPSGRSPGHRVQHLLSSWQDVFYWHGVGLSNFFTTFETFGFKYETGFFIVFCR